MTHCPYCNGREIAAIGPVSLSSGVVVEHRCKCCGQLFCIMDRRHLLQRERIPVFTVEMQHE